MEWPREQDYNRVTIQTSSPESIGVELGCLGAGTASGVSAANLAIFTPFVVCTPFIAVKIVTFNGATVSGNVDVGIYDDQQNRVVSMGSTAQSGVSTFQSFDITDTTLLPGCYFMAVNIDNTTGTFTRWVTSNIGGFGVYTQAVGAVTLPATATFASPTTLNIPHMAVTGRTVV